MASTGVALSFFGGGWWDGAAAFLLGCAVGALGFLAGRSGEDRRLLYAYEFLAAAMCALLVRCMDVLVPTCYEAVVLSALIWLLQVIDLGCCSCFSVHGIPLPFRLHTYMRALGVIFLTFVPFFSRGGR